MNSYILYVITVLIIGFILLLINYLFAVHKPYMEKRTAFECGFHSFLFQNRTQFNISFFIFALLFLIFDLEILLIFPYTMSAHFNSIYGLLVMLIFFVLLTTGLVYELGKKALSISSKQKLNL
jgi:NADH-ubiquinone oxidoreductase chain 3